MFTGFFYSIMFPKLKSEIQAIFDSSRVVLTFDSRNRFKGPIKISSLDTQFYAMVIKEAKTDVV